MGFWGLMGDTMQCVSPQLVDGGLHHWRCTFFKQRRRREHVRQMRKAEVLDLVHVEEARSLDAPLSKLGGGIAARLEEDGGQGEN